MSAPAGYEFIYWDTGLRCLACGGIVDGTMHWREFPKFHDPVCRGTQSGTSVAPETDDPKNTGTKPEPGP